MAHHLNCLIARPEVLKHVHAPDLRLLDLPQGLAMAPIPEDMVRALIGERDMLAEEILDELAQAASKAGPIGRLMSDWFGGNGSTDVALWNGGRRIPGSQDEMFVALGVRRASPRDEWDTLGLADHRHTERAYAAAKPVG